MSPISKPIQDEESLASNRLRQRRILGDHSTTSVLAAAALATAVIISSSGTEESGQTETCSSSDIHISSARSDCNDVNITNPYDCVMPSILSNVNFSVSPTQPCTPSDGNCMYHALADQTSFKDHLDARHQVVTSVYEMIEKNILYWNDSKPLSDWIESMMIPGTFGDAYSLQIAANILARDIILLPTKPESAHNTHGYILIESCTYNSNPVFMLYFEEYVYGAGHYQSVVPLDGNQIVKHYTWSKTVNKSVRSFSSSSSLFSSTKNNESLSSKRKADEYNDSSNKKRKIIAQGCHVCGKSFTHVKKKRCHCNKYCHKKCIGKCNDNTFV